MTSLRPNRRCVAPPGVVVTVAAWLCLVVGCAGGPGLGGRHPRVEPALAEARETGQPVLVILFEPGPDAERLEQHVLAAPRVHDLLAQFIVAPVDLVRWPSELSWRKTGNIPEIRVLDADGTDHGAIGGLPSPDELALFLTQALRSVRPPG